MLAADRDARAVARAYLDTLARLEALKPPAPLRVAFCGGCGQAIGFDAVLGSRCGCVGDRFGRAPYSKADQVRNALLAAFEPCGAGVRRDLRDALEGAGDAVLEHAGRLLKHYADK